MDFNKQISSKSKLELGLGLFSIHFSKYGYGI